MTNTTTHNSVKVDKVFVLHVQKGGEVRARHMENMLSKLGIEFEYMLDGNIEDITPQRLQRYFPDPAPTRWNSCAMKHLLVYEKMLEEGLKRVLVLEDDAILRTDFVQHFNRAIEELESKDSEPQFAFFEATHLWFIPRRLRKKGQMLYTPRGLQCMACYSINAECAKIILDAQQNERPARPIDMYVDSLWRRGVIPNLYQSHPDLCKQGSHVGQFSSLIGNPMSEKTHAALRYHSRYLFHKYVSTIFR